MNFSKIRGSIYIGSILIIGGCASSSDLAREAAMHQKSSAYYQSIGQPEAAKSEAQLAKQDKDRMFDVDTLFIDLLEAIWGK